MHVNQKKVLGKIADNLMNCARFQVSAEVCMTFSLSWVVKLLVLVNVFRRFGNRQYLKVSRLINAYPDWLNLDN